VSARIQFLSVIEKTGSSFSNGLETIFVVMVFKNVLRIIDLRVQLLKQFKLLDMFILISTWTGLKFHRKYFTGFSKKVCYNQCATKDVIL